MYIVGYWHLFNYTNAFPHYFNFITYNLTLIVLAVFVFISGFLVSGSPNAEHENKTLVFYQRKLLRIFPLYLVALIVFYVFGINNEIVTLKAVFLTSMLFKPAPTTLWFITMIMLFFALVPLLIHASKNLKLFLLVSILFILFFALMEFLFNSVDHRIFIYFPIFCYGIYYSRSERMFSGKQLKFILGVCLIAMLGMTIQNKPEWLVTINECIVASTGAILVFTFARNRAKKFVPNKLILIASFSSFSMYLFHRPLYEVLKNVYFPADGMWQILYLYFCLVIIVLVSWWIQFVYDRCLKALNN